MKIAFKKILLLWQQSWCLLTRVPVTDWLGLLIIHMQRFYHTLVTTYAFFILAAYIVSMHYVTQSLWGIFLTLLVLSYMMYLMRPTAGLKKMAYLHEYFCLETITSTCAIISTYIFFVSIMPKFFTALILIMALCSFSFLYDISDSIPDKVAYTLIRTGYFVIYNAPALIGVALVTVLINYFDGGLVGIMVKALVCYPFLSAYITLIYVIALHENYELYYAE
ncbi:MAG: hypothetical protein K2X90_02430 [Candidatus Babeliaceae bacterium]|nr:hypothetical protein [Candidatus Babeliaceae bacterium]